MGIAAYHYTTAPTLKAILTDGLLRAYPQQLFGDARGTRLVATTKPCVWLTLNPLGEGTTLAKAMAWGYRGNGVGFMGRVAVGDAVPLLTLAEFTDWAGVPETAWDWVLRTADMLNIDPSVWRLCPRDIPKAEWARVELLADIDQEGTTWRPHQGGPET